MNSQQTSPDVYAEVKDGLSRDSAQPVHEQLSDLLREKSREIGKGGKLPPELTLMKQYSVSRATVRRAIDTLVTEGLLARHQGKGTFIRGDRMVHSLDQLRPFITMFMEAGEQPEGTILVHEWLEKSSPMPGPLAELDVDALHLRRLYHVKDVAPAIADIFIPEGIAQHISRADLEEQPVYQVVENKLGLVPAYADIAVRSEALARDFTALDAEVGSPLLILQRTTYDASDTMLESTLLYLRPESFELQLRVRAGGPNDLHYKFPNDSPRLVVVDEKPSGEDTDSPAKGEPV